MKRMIAMLLMFVMLISVLPIQTVVAAKNTYLASMQEGKEYLIYTGEVCLSAVESGEGLAGTTLPVEGETAKNCTWTFTNESYIMNGNVYLSIDGERLFLSDSVINAVSVNTDECVSFYADNERVRLAYDGVNNRFVPTLDESSECTLEIQEYNETAQITSVELGEETLMMIEGEKRELIVNVQPTEAEEELLWTSTDSSIVTVDKGEVTAVDVGNANITVSTVDGEFSDTCSVTVRAQEYTVSFYDIDGSELSKQSVVSGGAAEAPFVPEHVGYEFVGWVPADFSNITADTKVYSSWNTYIYDITLVLNGGTCSEFPSSYTIETEEIVLPVPIRNGYTFRGWYENQNYTGDPILTIKKGTYGDKTLYARWNINSYSIAYVLSGGELNGSFFSSYTIESPDIYLPQPVRLGYDFIGWYKSAQLTGEKVECIKNGSYGNMRFYAAWKPHTYAINYIVSGGSLSGSYAVEYNVESGYITLPTPTRTGYRFDGWYTTEGFSGNSISGIETGTVGNKTYYAKWTILQYMITIRSNGGTVMGVVPATYTIESKEIQLPTATRSGYTFCGWYNNADYIGTQVLCIEEGSYGDVTFYARWEVIQYTIGYVLNGGTVTETAPAGYNIESTDILLPVVERTAYRFDGWYENASFAGSAVTAVEQGSVGNKIFYAKWTPITYRITYITNGGSISGVTTTSYNVESASFMLPLAVRNGYKFFGWYSSSGLTGNPATQVLQGSYGDRAYYAKWETISYSISYDTCGGTISDEYPQEYTIESVSFSLPTPQKRGYEFLGWYENADYSGRRVRTIAVGSYGDKQFFAKWSILNYTITYNINGGSVIGEATTNYSVESGNISMPRIIKTGYTFNGWYDNPSFTGTAINTIYSGTVGDLEFYASFTPITYKLIYNTNGGSLSNVISVYNIETQTFRLPIPERIGYKFAGWYINEDCTGNAVTDIKKGTYGDITLYADWEIIKYKITYHVYDGAMPTESYAVTYDIESSTIVLPRPTQEGHVFVGWYDNRELTGVAVREIDAGSYGDKEFFAYWRKLKHNVRFFDRDYSTLLLSTYVEHGSAAIPPDDVPDHYGYTFSGWSEDYTCVTSSLDCIAVYELTEYDVVFVDMDYTIISQQKVRHGNAATAPTPPEHEDCEFVFWSCDFEYVESDLTVVAIYRTTTVIPAPAAGQRFVRDEGMNSGEDYIITAETDTETYALTSLCRNDEDGMWAMQLEVKGNTIKPTDTAAQMSDVVFHAEGSQGRGLALTSEMSGEKLTCESDDLTMCSAGEEHDKFEYVYENDAWRVYDVTNDMYLHFDADARYFETSNLENSTPITIYKRINLPTYMQMRQPYFGKLYTVVAVRPSGQAYAIAQDGESYTGIPVEIADGELYFNENIDEKTVAFRVAFGDNDKGFALRCVSSSLYLGLDAGKLVPTADMRNYWVYRENMQSGEMSLYEVNAQTYVFCNDEGEFFAQNSITHSKILIFERRPSGGRNGDVNMDGVINTGDAVTILKHASGAKLLSDESMTLGDTNSDGKVNTGDAVMILRYVIGSVDWI